MPGTLPVDVSRHAAAAPAEASDNSIKPFYSASGKVSLSTNGAGTNSGPASRDIIKPTGATVRAAFLLAAGTGNSSYTPHDGDITIDGTPVDFDESTAITNSIGSGNIRADVTSIVAPIINTARPGPVAITLSEILNTNNIDGEILAVVFDDPNVGADNSVSLLYGAQQTTGDTFNILLSKPVDRGSPNFALTLGLGISYSFQPVGQFSQVDVNGQRLTTSAGGQDDGEGANGALITVGGVGDSPDNPPDPNANDLQCGDDPPAPRCDDELYSLAPFVANGDTRIAVDTLNPSNDDNIFFSSLEFRGTSAVVGEGVVLSPPEDSQPVGGSHTSTATVQNSAGSPVAGKQVDFRVTDGPNAGLTDSEVTDESGQATFTYSSSLSGTDTVVASFLDSNDVTQTSNSATVTWMAQAGGQPIVADDSYATAEDQALAVSPQRGVLANDSDPEESPISATLGTPPAHGSVTLRPNGSFTYRPAANFNGTDTFTYTASDGTNVSDPATVTITVRPTPDGVQANDDSYTATEGQTFLITDPARGVLANDINADGGILTAAIVSSPTHGSLDFNDNGTFSYTPEGRGGDSFTYRATNSLGETSNLATVRLDVAPVNHPPTGNPDSYLTNEDTPLVTGPETGAQSVLANDTDPDGDTLTASLVSGTAHGTVLLQPNGNFVYTPDTDYNGPDSFFYNAFDGAASSGATEVDITVAPVNDRPVANGDTYTATQDTPLQVAAPGILGNDVDVDGDPLIATVLATTTHGTLTLNPGDGSFRYVPRRGFVGLDSFTYVASDHNGGEGSLTSAPAVVMINVVPPVLPPVGVGDHYRTRKNVSLRIDRPGVLGNDTGPVGDALSAALVRGPTHGSIQLRPGGGFVYSPGRDFVGTDTFRYRAVNGSLASSAVLVTIDVVGSITPPPPPPPPPSTPPPPTPSPSAPPLTSAPIAPEPSGEPTTTELPSAPATGPTTPSTAPSTPSTPFPSTSTPASPPSSSPNVITRVPNGLTLSSPSINPGGTASASGSGCAAGAAVTLTIDGRSAGSGTADSKGHFAVRVNSPPLAIGKYTVVATCGNRQLTAPVAFVSITGNSAAPAARALTVGSVMAFFLLFLGLALRRPGVGK